MDTTTKNQLRSIADALYKATDAVAVIWTVEDVRKVARGMTPPVSLSDAECTDILERASRDENNWLAIDATLCSYIAERDELRHSPKALDEKLEEMLELAGEVRSLIAQQGGQK